MAGTQAVASPVRDECEPEATIAMVRVDALRRFGDVVTGLGGDPASLLAAVNIDPALLDHRHALIPYRRLLQLLECCAVELECADFGMRLATAQGGVKVLGPLEFVMRNCGTVREAFRYCAQHPQVYSSASQMRWQPDPAEAEVFLRHEILLPKLPPHCQAVERALLLTQHAALALSGGRARAREIWFMHQPLSPLAGYRDYFGSSVRFGRPMNGLLFADAELDMPIPDVDAQLYELATEFIESRFPAGDALGPRLRGIVERLLLEGDCTHDAVAAMLGLHPRTLQRRLRAEGASFEAIKDGVRREIALRYLQQSGVPLIEVARMLGYADTAALSRSCYRWFSASPRELRRGGLENAAPRYRHSA